MLCFILLTLIALGTFANYTDASINFIDITSECYKDTTEVIREFEEINDIVLTQILPEQNDQEPTQEYVWFLNNYTEMIHNLTIKIQNEYLENPKIKKESKYVLTKLIDVLVELKQTFTDLARVKYFKLINNEINQEVQTLLNLFDQLKNKTETLTREHNCQRIYYFSMFEPNMTMFTEELYSNETYTKINQTLYETFNVTIDDLVKCIQ